MLFTQGMNIKRFVIVVACSLVAFTSASAFEPFRFAVETQIRHALINAVVPLRANKLVFANEAGKVGETEVKP